MLLTTLKRIIKSGFVNFWRNRSVTIASVFVMCVTLFVIGSLILGGKFLNSTLDDIKNRVDISVTFKSDATEDSILAMKKSVELLPEVKSVTYTSRDKELEDFRARHQDNALLIQSLDEVGNPFGARVAILARDPAQYESVSKYLQSQNGGDGSGIIDQISFKKDIIDKLLSVIATSQKVGVIISILLIAMSILVTFNTISLAIYTSKDEISVMRLVGASSFYVRGPFMVEGILAGLVASLLAIILLYPMSVWVRNATIGVYGGLDMVSFYVQSFAQVFLVLLGSGVVLGLISSFLATRKYLKV